MYDLDEVDASEDVVDEIPEFMKPDETPDEEESGGESERSGETSDTDRQNRRQSDDE
jgi:hypothetical protein